VFSASTYKDFFPEARKYWSLQGIYKEIKLKEIARISVTYTSSVQFLRILQWWGKLPKGPFSLSSPPPHENM
jgi:hypothetical protein